MAAIALANIAAATAAGYILERWREPDGTYCTKLSFKTSGLNGREGAFMEWQGRDKSASATADAAALANLNAWRNTRYGVDSGSVSTDPTPTAATSPSTQGVTPTHRSMTKDRD
jgi:hypothetical protein